MSEDESDGRWVDEPPLPELDNQPPAGTDLDLGAVLLHVHGIREILGQRQRHGHTPVVVIARCQLGPRTWAILCAWQGHWQQGTRTTGKARCGWLRYEVPEPGVLGAVQLMPNPPSSILLDGFEWHGHHELSQFAKAVREAAEILPPEMRAQALTPKQDR